MDMRHTIYTFAAVSAAALSMFSCAKETAPAGSEEETGRKITITASLPEGMDSKVTFTGEESALKLAWETTDAIRVISETGTSEIYTVKEIDGKTATFEGNEVEGSEFSVIYPGTYATLSALEARSYTAQSQSGNGSTSHLVLNAAVTGLSSYDGFSFAADGAKLNGAIRFRLKMPDVIGNVTALTLSASSEIFYTDNAGTAKTSSLTLALTDADVSENHILTAYLMTPWTEAEIASGTELTLTVTADGAVLKKTFVVESAVSLAGGCLNTIQLNDGNWESVLSGEGTEASPYQLRNRYDLLAMKSLLVEGETKWFEMMNDIDMSPIDNWTPLNNDGQFKLGINFNGNGFTLKNLVSKDVRYAGFFGVLYGVCRDVKFTDAEVSSNVSGSGILGGYVGTTGLPGYVSGVEVSGNVTNNNVDGIAGGLCGVAREATIVNCKAVSVTVTNNVKSTAVGGLCGTLRGATVTGCEVDATVLSKFGDGATLIGAGGIAGRSENNVTNIVKDCIAKGSVEITNGTQHTYTGGIIGYEVVSGAQISGCTAYSNIRSAGQYAGGIVGYYTGGTLSGCKFYGTVTAAGNNTGGIVGVVANESEITGCVSAGSVSGNGGCGGIAGATEGVLTISECLSSGTVKASGNGSGGIIGNGKSTVALTVKDCLFTGTLTGGQHCGGVVGDLFQNSSVSRCCVAGSITGWGTVGGIVGRAGNGSWTAEDSGYSDTIESCIVWTDNLTATRPVFNGGSSGAVIGFTGVKNTLKDCWRKSGMTLTANFCSDLYDQENADSTTPLVISGTPSGFDYIYPYHGKAAGSSATPVSLAASLGWDGSVWDLTGTELVLKTVSE